MTKSPLLSFLITHPTHGCVIRTAWYKNNFSKNVLKTWSVRGFKTAFGGDFKKRHTHSLEYCLKRAGVYRGVGEYVPASELEVTILENNSLTSNIKMSFSKFVRKYIYINEM